MAPVVGARPAALLLLLVVQGVLAQARAVLHQRQLGRPRRLAQGVVPLAGLTADQEDDLLALLGLRHGTATSAFSS